MMMRLWPDSLAGRTLVLLLSMTLLLIVISALLVQEERKQRFEERNQFHMLERVVTLVRLLSDADTEERNRIIKRVKDEDDDISLTELPRVADATENPVERRISRRLGRSLHLRNPADIRVSVQLEERLKHSREGEHRPFGRKELPALSAIDISIRLWDDIWLNFKPGKLQEPPPWASRTLQLLALLLILVIVSALIIAQRMARPMAQLASAADHFGLGHAISPLEEKGPREVRHTIRAFNRMQQRLHKHITDRSHMLAAVSHDLKTPITTLRLRAEYIEDSEMREKTLATLSEMENILSATLSFARDEAADENARATNVAALIQSLVDDHVDLGGMASYDGPDKLIFICRPVALKRALNNLVDNALKYGESALVKLVKSGSGIEIIIEDQGPGIPEQNFEDVFTPFFRLESSRNRDTGGTGLGMAVARTIVFAHGGELELKNMTAGGLRVVIRFTDDSLGS